MKPCRLIRPKVRELDKHESNSPVSEQVRNDTVTQMLVYLWPACPTGYIESCKVYLFQLYTTPPN